mmetsp:Transcript_52933/g.146682  ORF Transcript_52933/g.146682 Transcript_52933/m.146682 type:complete len:431 (+) Transcript_52933:434-1726(+)
MDADLVIVLDVAELRVVVLEEQPAKRDRHVNVHVTHPRVRQLVMPVLDNLLDDLFGLHGLVPLARNQRRTPFLDDEMDAKLLSQLSDDCAARADDILYACAGYADACLEEVVEHDPRVALLYLLPDALLGQAHGVRRAPHGDGGPAYRERLHARALPEQLHRGAAIPDDGPKFVLGDVDPQALALRPRRQPWSLKQINVRGVQGRHLGRQRVRELALGTLDELAPLAQGGDDASPVHRHLDEGIGDHPRRNLVHCRLLRNKPESFGLHIPILGAPLQHGKPRSAGANDQMLLRLRVAEKALLARRSCSLREIPLHPRLQAGARRLRLRALLRPLDHQLGRLARTTPHLAHDPVPGSGRQLLQGHASICVQRFADELSSRMVGLYLLRLLAHLQHASPNQRVVNLCRIQDEHANVARTREAPPEDESGQRW